MRSSLPIGEIDVFLTSVSCISLLVTIPPYHKVFVRCLSENSSFTFCTLIGLLRYYIFFWRQLKLIDVQMVQSAGEGHSDRYLPAVHLQLLHQPTLFHRTQLPEASLPQLPGVEAPGLDPGKTSAADSLCKYRAQIGPKWCSMRSLTQLYYLSWGGLRIKLKTN